MSDVSKQLPQAGANPAADSDRVKAPVVGTGPTDSGGGQTHSKQTKDNQDTLGASGQMKSTSGVIPPCFVLRGLSRTPPKNTRSLSVGDISPFKMDSQQTHVEEDNLDGSEMAMKKRRYTAAFEDEDKRDLGSSSGSQENKEAKEALKKFARAIEETIKLCGQLEEQIDKNTKREIKAISINIKRQMVNLKATGALDIINSGAVLSKPKMVDSDTQTENSYLENKSSEDILTLFDAAETYPDFQRIADLNWSEEVFTNTEVTTAALENIKNDTVRVIVIESNISTESQKLVKTYQDTYPELSAVTDDFAVVEQSYTIKTGSCNIPVAKKTVQIRYDGNEDTFFTNLVKTKQEVEQFSNITINTPESIDNDRMRKLVESVFHNSDTSAVIRMNKDTRTKKERKTYALVVGCEQDSYQNTLKNVKQILKEKDIKDGILGIRSTREGKLLITMNKTESTVMSVHSALKGSEKLGMEKISRISDEKMVTIHIRGMDEDTSKEEVIAALENEVSGLREKYFKLSDLRPWSNNRQAVTLTLNETDAVKLLASRFIIIGFSRCYLEKRIPMERCRLCWEFGHKAEKCNKTDRSKLCFKCSKEGHSIKECKNPEFCPLCNTEGHKAGDGRCKAFKRSLSYARKKQLLPGMQVLRSDQNKATSRSTGTNIYQAIDNIGNQL